MRTTALRSTGVSIVALLLALLVAGCYSGPYHDPEYDIPSLKSDSKFTEIIVSGFVTAEKATTVTGSLQIQTIMESASVYDMSAEVAASLVASGVKAEARDKFDSKSLQPHQLLLRGAVVASAPMSDGFGAWAVPYFLTLGLFGLWAPSPFTYDTGYDVKYRVDLIDSTGRYLLSTGSKDSKIFIKSRHVAVSRPDKELFELMRKNMAAEIAKKIRL